VWLRNSVYACVSVWDFQVNQHTQDSRRRRPKDQRRECSSCASNRTVPVPRLFLADTSFCLLGCFYSLFRFVSACCHRRSFVVSVQCFSTRDNWFVCSDTVVNSVELKPRDYTVIPSKSFFQHYFLSFTTQTRLSRPDTADTDSLNRHTRQFSL
jgi:hypothetical protein